MNKLTVFVSLFFGTISQAQLKPLDIKHPPTAEQVKQSDQNIHCKIHNKYSVGQRRKFYPFSVAEKVELISYNWPDSVIMGGKIPLKEGRLDKRFVRETIVLSEEQIDSLTQILYNVGYKGFFFTDKDIKCYNPRNAIVFFNASGRLLAYIELCFECQKQQLSSPKIKTGDFCFEKYELLRKFFLKTGVKHGTQKEVFEKS